MADTSFRGTHVVCVDTLGTWTNTPMNLSKAHKLMHKLRRDLLSGHRNCGQRHLAGGTTAHTHTVKHR